MSSNYLLKAQVQADPTPPPPPSVHHAVTAATLSDLDLEDELLNQYKATQSLLQAASTDMGTPLNQKAQILNTGYAILSGIIKLQESLHNVESLKVLESCLIDTLKEFEPIKASFLARYEQTLVKRSTSSLRKTLQEQTAKEVSIPPLYAAESSNNLQLQVLENLTPKSDAREIESATNLFLKNFDKE